MAMQTLQIFKLKAVNDARGRGRRAAAPALLIHAAKSISGEKVEWLRARCTDLFADGCAA
jgi:hypothetical protein